METKNVNKVRIFWEHIRKGIQQGDEQLAFKLFLYILNHYRNRGVTDAVRSIDQKLFLLPDQLAQVIRKNINSAVNEAAQKNKRVFNPKVNQPQAKAPNLLNDTLAFLKSKSGLELITNKRSK